MQCACFAVVVMDSCHWMLFARRSIQVLENKHNGTLRAQHLGSSAIQQSMNIFFETN